MTSAGAFRGGALVNAADAWGGNIMLGETAPLGPRAPIMQLTEPVPAFASAVFGALGDALSAQADGGRRRHDRRWEVGPCLA